MPRIFKGIESELRLLLHPCILTGEITDIKVALFTNDPSVAIEFTDRYTIDDNILTLTVPTWAFGTMEEGVINYVIQGMHNDDAFITDRQSNYYLKTPTDYIPEEMPEEVVLGELTTMIVENGVFEYTPSDVDAWNKATIEVNVPDTNGSYDEGYKVGKNDGYDSGYQDGYNAGQPIKYNTIADIYGSPSDSTVNFKGLVALSFAYGSGYYILFTDHTGSILLRNHQDPLMVGDECVVTATLRRSDTSYISVLFTASVEVLSSNNYVVMPADAVELTNVDDLYIPNENGYAEMKYLYVDGKVGDNITEKFIRLETDASSDGNIGLRGDFKDWVEKLKEGDSIRVYMFTENSTNNFDVKDIVQLGTEGGSCNLGEGEIYLTANDAGFYELYAAEDGYDGWSKFYVTLEGVGAIKIHKAEELIQMFNDGGGIDFGAYYYVGGKITEIQEINTEFGNATYVLDNGFKVYRGDWIDGNPFGEDQIKVGAYIAVYGIIQDYKGELQFKAHSQVIAYQECEGGEIVSCNIQEYKWVRPSMADRAENGDIYIYPDEGFDAVGYIDLDPSDIYNEAFAQGKAEGKAEGGDLNIDAVSTSLGVGKGYNWTRTAAQYGLDGITEITIDGSQYQEWTKAYTLLQAYQNTEETYITENGEYRPNIGYDGFALNGYNVGWVIDVIPTIDTDVEMWVKPYDGATNMWQGFIGSQVSDDDNTTFQIRKVDGSNAFSFRFGNMEFEYGFEYERWYRLRMNRNGIWVNGEQVCGWDVQVFEENPNPLMINGIYNLGFESENYRMNFASYGYVYFHNTDSLLVPFNNGLFIGNKNQTIGRPAADGATLRLERNWYPKGYTKVVVDVQNGGGNCDDAYNSGYNQGYNDGQANCDGGEGGSCNLINPIFFCGTEGNTINAESVEIPTFVYEGNQHYNVWPLNMAEYEEFKIRIRFQPTNGGNEEPVNIFGCENTDWDDTTFGARIYQGQIYFRMSGLDVSYPYSDYAWYDVEMGYNSSKRWITVNGETLLETDHAFVNKPSQTFMIGAINSGGNAFRPFYGKIAAAYIEANGSQVWLLPKEEGHMDVYWNDRNSPWVSLNGESNARFEGDWMSGDGMKTITWLGKKEAPTKEEVQGQVDQYTRPAVIFEGVTEVFVEEPHKLQTDDLVEATAWISTKDTVNNKWCLWTKEGKYEGVSVLNGSAFGGDYFEAKCIRLTGITKLFSATFFPISAEEIHFGNIEYIETSAIESMDELKKIFYTGDGNVTIDNNAIRGANPNGTLYLKNGVDETPWLERLPEGWVVERLNDDGSVNCGGDIEDYAKNQARVLNVTENGVYTSQYTQDGDIVINSNQQITGVYDDGTEFYDTAVLEGALIPLNIVPTEETRIEFWYLPNKPHMGDGFHQIIQSTNEQISFVFGGGGVDNKNINLKFGNKSVDYTPTKSFGTEWLHIIVDRNGATVNDVEMPFDATATFNKAETNLYVNGSKLNNRKANGTFGMVKIDGTTFIPKEGGYLNLTTNELCPFEQPNLGVLDDGTPITKGAFLDYSVYDTGLKITEDSVIDMWFVRPTNGIVDYVFKSPLFNVRYDSNKYYIMTNGVEQGVYEYGQTKESVINITISKADGFKKIGTYATKTISLSDAVLSSGNHTLLLDSKYNTYGLIKIDGNVIIPTENGFLNTTTNEYLKKVEEYGGEYVYMNPFYEYVNNTEKTPIEIDGNLIKTVNVNVVPKLKLADEKFTFRGAQFTKIPEWADIDGIEDMSNFFDSCNKLTEIRWFDASRTTNMSAAFSYCSEFTHFPSLNTIKVTKMDQMFNACNKMVSVPPLDARNVKKHTYGPIGSWTLSNLTDFGGLIGLRASMDGSYGFDKCPNLSYQSCINILNGLYDFVGNGETPASNEGKFKVHSNFLTTVGDEISIGVQKGWTITA